MIAKQLSVYVENKPGKLVEKIKALAEAGVDIRALYIAESKDFGILRLLVDDEEKGKAALSGDSLVKVTDVIKVEMNDHPGAMHEILCILSGAGINVEYMYAYTTPVAGACAVFRVQDCAAAEAILEANGIK